MPPPTAEKFKKIADEYQSIWNFPQRLGAIDGKHVRIICQAHSGTMYYNYKSHYSIVLQGVADAFINLRLLMLVTASKVTEARCAHRVCFK
jgi:hypothetical protein